jgi:hypothetical protein
MRQASPLVASLGDLNAVSFIPLPFLACDMQQSPGNGMQPLHHLRTGPVGVALPVVQAVGAALGGACVVQWRVSSTEHPRFLVSGQIRAASIPVPMEPEIWT